MGTCSSLLLWSAVLLLLLPSLRLRLILLFSMEPMPDTHMLPDMPDTAMDTHMPMAFMERDLLMLSQRLMPTTMVMLDLMLMDTDHMDTQLTVMVTTERDLLMLSQRLRLMLTMVFTDRSWICWIRFENICRIWIPSLRILRKEIC